MQNLSLKKFQIDAVNHLLDATTFDKKEILLQAPTGSGKTIILLSFIEQYLEDNNNAVFIWLSPGAGELEEQSLNKMNLLLPNYETKSIQDVLLRGFNNKDTAFINWETITKKDNNALKKVERKNLYERIVDGSNKGLKYIVIVDEEHLNKTIKAESIIEFIKPEYIVRASATTKLNKEATLVEIDELQVINEGLITKALYINENISSEVELVDEHEYLLQIALKKRNQIKSEYLKNGIQVNPLTIIQFPSKSNELILKVEELLKKYNITYDNGGLAKWLSDEKINLENITNNEAHQSVLLMKQAISTGWDCPRAKILIKLRDNMSEEFETQTIGRIRRMPQAHHYENVLLDNCYLYTFDSKYEQAVKQELGNQATNCKIVFLKNEFKNIKLVKIKIDSDFDGFDERQTFRILQEFYIEKYGLNNDKNANKIILESKGYIFKNNIENYIVQGKFIKLTDISNSEKIKIETVVTSGRSGYEYRSVINEIASKIGLRYDRVKLMFEKLFLKSKLFTKKFINLSQSEYYAFVINNYEILKKDFEEAVNQKARQTKMQLEGLKEIEWSIPDTDYIKYDAKMKDTAVMKKNVYNDYPNSTIKSSSERMFEKYCETCEDIKWFYKNGESSDNYFSIVYENAVNKRWHFYPDYIISDKNDNIWIIETKGGETLYGISKNIDIKAENKFEALKTYSKKYNVNWAFVRDYEKNGSLYFNNTEYTESMETDNWKSIDKMIN